MTLASIKLDTWKGTEWFGTEFPYAPYWDANEYHTAYGLYSDSLTIDIIDSFEFLSVFLAGEFLCSFELSMVHPSSGVIKFSKLDLIKDMLGR